LSPIKQNYYNDQSIFLSSRLEQYFYANKAISSDYIEAATIINALKPGSIGLILGTNHWEYPIWVLTGSHASTGDLNYYHILGKDDFIKSVVSSDVPPEIIWITRFNFLSDINIEKYSVIYDSPSVRLLGIP
jgi:hypothetical protein